jgi:hypothetical protein
MSDQGTSVVTRGGAYVKQLARRVAVNSAKAKLARIGTPGEAEDSAREDATTSDIDDEEVLIPRAELKGFTQALTGVVQMLNLLLKKCKLDKDKDESIREVGNLIKGTLAFLEQCGEMKTRRRKRGIKPVDGAVSGIVAVNRGYPKRKETLSPVELAMVEERKRSRRGEASYADVCGKVPRRTKVEEIYNDEFCSESEGWQRVERRRRE